MSGALTDILKRRMALTGPISVADFMAEALGHPDHGYYMQKDPLGVGGDFTTSPEISQMFGELIGLWCGVCWSQLAGPECIHLVELGPGRGTLMSDALRAARNVPGFLDAVQVHLVETSPALRAKQKEALTPHMIAPQWHDGIETLPTDAPFLVVANEFFDALPVRQFVLTERGWCERGVTWDEEAKCFGFVLSGAPTFPAEELPKAELGQIFELSTASTASARDLGRRLTAQDGAALIIDYGHGTSAPGDTLQAMRDHKFHDALVDPGSADITAHVDFQSLKTSFEEGGADCHPLLTQRDFLTRLGINERATLLTQANPEKTADVESGLNRLIDEDQMGTLFKVLGVVSGLQAPGFDQLNP